MLILGHDVSRIMDAYFRRKVQDLCKGIVSTILKGFYLIKPLKF